MNVCMNYKMLEYDKIHISIGIYINKTNESKECDADHSWYFLDEPLSTNNIFAMAVMI